MSIVTTEQTIEKALLGIMQHTLGLNEYGEGEAFRNHFVAGGENLKRCRELVARGYMSEHPASVISGGSPWFHVTPEGKSAVAQFSPARPPEKKLTRSQQRYRDYRRSECCESFGEWLKAGMWRGASR